MRILSAVNSKRRHAHISMVMSTSMVCGYILSWAVLGSLFSGGNWKMLFLLPAVMVIIPLVIWSDVLRSGRGLRFKKKKAPGLRPTVHIIKKSHLIFVIGICVCSGLIRESISIWAPVMMVKTLGFKQQNSFLLLFIVPLFNFGGILFARWLQSRGRKLGLPGARIEPNGRIGNMLMIFFAGTLLCGAGFLVFSGVSGLLGLFFISLISGMSFGANSILLSFIPLSQARHGIVSTLVGVFDFFTYIGAAVSAYGLGFMLEGNSGRFIPLIWMFFAAAAVVLGYFYKSAKRKEPGDGGE